MTKTTHAPGQHRCSKAASRSPERREPGDIHPPRSARERARAAEDARSAAPRPGAATPGVPGTQARGFRAIFSGLEGCPKHPPTGTQRPSDGAQQEPDTGAYELAGEEHPPRASEEPPRSPEPSTTPRGGRRTHATPGAAWAREKVNAWKQEDPNKLHVAGQVFSGLGPEQSRPERGNQAAARREPQRLAITSGVTFPSASIRSACTPVTVPSSSTAKPSRENSLRSKSVLSGCTWPALIRSS